MDALSILIVVSLGLFAGTGIGLFIGFIAKIQPADWREMTRRQVLINAALCILGSAACTAGIAWYAFFR